MNIELITAISALVVALLSTAFGIFVGFRSEKRVKLESIKDFYAEYYSEEMVDQREKLGKIMWRNIPYEYDEHGNFVRFIEFFDKWGALCLNGYLPFLIFEGSIGIYVISTYKYLFEYIDSRRKGLEVSEYKTNPRYAYHMEKLIDEIEKRLKLKT